MILTMDEFKRLCRMGAGLLDGATPGLDPYAVLYALGRVESQFGAICSPRFEKAYSWNQKGRFASKVQHQLHGDHAACSYGPWQIMYLNALGVLPGITPALLQASPGLCLEASCLFLYADVIGKRKAHTIEQVLDCWNTGNYTDNIKPADWYMRDGVAAYRDALAR